jgi:Domain of unknown function (DUF4232)
VRGGDVPAALTICFGDCRTGNPTPSLSVLGMSGTYWCVSRVGTKTMGSRLFAALAAGAGLALVGGCASSPSSSAGSSATAALSGTTASSAGSGTGAPSSTQMPPCVSGSLALKMVESVSGETGERAFVVQLWNREPQGCSLRGYPIVQFLSSTGAAVRFVVADGQGYVNRAAPRRVELEAGASAFVMIAKYRCDVGDRTVATTVLITPPGQAGSITAELPPNPTFAYCGPSDPGDTVYVSPLAGSESDLFFAAR